MRGSSGRSAGVENTQAKQQSMNQQLELQFHSLASALVPTAETWTKPASCPRFRLGQLSPKFLPRAVHPAHLRTFRHSTMATPQRAPQNREWDRELGNFLGARRGKKTGRFGLSSRDRSDRIVRFLELSEVPTFEVRPGRFAIGSNWGI